MGIQPPKEVIGGSARKNSPEVYEVFEVHRRRFRFY